MQYRQRAIISVVVVGLFGLAVFAVSLMEQTTYHEKIAADSQLRQAVALKLRELKARGTLSARYCAWVDYPPARVMADLNSVVPGHDFVRLNFRARVWKQFFPSGGPSTQRAVLAIRKSDGQAEFLSEPLTILKAYPNFLVWAKARIQSEKEACAALAVVINSVEFSVKADQYMACQDQAGTWRVGEQPTGCDDPELILKTDKKGFVVGGQMTQYEPVGKVR